MSALFTALLEGETKESLATMVCGLREEITRLRTGRDGALREMLERVSRISSARQLNEMMPAIRALLSPLSNGG